MSIVCLVQCLMLPVLVVVSPLTSLGFFGEESVSFFCWLTLILPISLIAFALGYRIHRNRSMLIPGLTGLAIVAAATLFGSRMAQPAGKLP